HAPPRVRFGTATRGREPAPDPGAPRPQAPRLDAALHARERTRVTWRDQATPVGRIAGDQLPGEDFPSEPDELVRLREGGLQVLRRQVVEAVVSFVLEVDQSAHRVGRALAAWLDQFEKGFGVVMILTARPATEGLAAGCIGGGDACKDGERCCRARPVGI